MLHGHGDDWYKYKNPVKYNFSSNVWYEGTPEKLLNVLREAIGSIGRYPSPDAGELAELAAPHHNLTKSHCLFTNGATEAFYLIASLFSQKAATVFTPAFAEYGDACIIHEVRTAFHPLRLFKTAPVETDLVFICNPNNPDGFITPVEDFEWQISSNPNSIFVVDEAYIDFAEGVSSCVYLIDKYPNLIVVKSLTKLFCIPGIRLGYILSNPALIERLQQKKMPWSVNSIAIEAGKYIFRHYEELKPDTIKGVAESRELQKEIAGLKGFSVIQANTTFFLLKPEKGTAAELKEFLMQQYQLLVRDATNFKGLEGEYIRVAVQSPEGNKLLIKGLKKWSRN